MAGLIGEWYASKGSRIEADSVIMYQSEWSVDDKADPLDLTMFETDGEEMLTTGIEGLDYNCGGNFRADVNAFSAPGIFPQDSFPNLLLYLNVAGGSFWEMPFAAILSANNGTNVKQLVTFKWAGRSQPGWSRPD